MSSSPIDFVELLWHGTRRESAHAGAAEEQPWRDISREQYPGIAWASAELFSGGARRLPWAFEVLVTGIAATEITPRPASRAGGPDPFSHIKQYSTGERDAMVANFRKVLADFDTDGDGKLSREEAPLLVREQFDRYDTDHDGFITLEDAQRWD